MVYSVKPIIVVSKCLGFDKCRFNGTMENNDLIEKLKDYVEFIIVCPEVECGLPIPRDSMRIVQTDDDIRLIQSKTKIDLTDEMNKFSKNFLSENTEIDGFILKSKSPSCGINDAKIYSSIEKGSQYKKGKGFFTKEIVKNYPSFCVENEGRLTNFKIREFFLTRIFLLANFRYAKKQKNMDSLKSFHLKNTLLFFSYSQKYSKILDQLIFDSNNANMDILLHEYEFNLLKLLDKAPRYTSNINVLLKSVEQFRLKITDEEMQFIWNVIDKYRNGFVPFSVPLYLVKGYVVRFNIENLANQSFFEPYPEALVQLADSGKSIH